MKGDAKAIKRLRRLLAGALTAIDQRFVHARMYEHWGLKERYGRIELERTEALGHAARLIQRTLFLEGTLELAARKPPPASARKGLLMSRAVFRRGAYITVGGHALAGTAPASGTEPFDAELLERIERLEEEEPGARASALDRARAGCRSTPLQSQAAQRALDRQERAGQSRPRRACLRSGESRHLGGDGDVGGDVLRLVG